MDVMVIMVLSILVEAILEVVKGWAPESIATPYWLWPAVGAVLGAVVCIAAGVDVFPLLNVQLSIPYLGAVLTGILISRGASFVHDVWGRIQGIE